MEIGKWQWKVEIGMAPVGHRRNHWDGGVIPTVISPVVDEMNEAGKLPILSLLLGDALETYQEKMRKIL